MSRVTLSDDRTDQEKKTHTTLVKGRDTFLSGWGKAKRGKSYAIWACTSEVSERVFDWVKSRKDMAGVRLVDEEYVELTSQPHKKNHVKIYVVGENHPSLEKDSERE